VAGAQDCRAGWHGLARDMTQAHRVHERLRQLAHRDRVRSVLRDEDVLGRFGGDEFVVALPARPAAGGR